MSVSSVLRQHPRRTWQAERPRTFYLVAPAGVPNWGDELIVATWLRYLARTNPDATVVVDCHSPGKAAVLLRGLHPNLVVTNTLWDLVERAGREVFPQGDTAVTADEVNIAQLAKLCELTRSWVLDGGAQADLATNLDLVGNADVLHVVGGGYLNDMWPHHAAIIAAVAAVAERQRPEGEPRPLFVATGAGLMPQRQGIILPYLLQADVVTVRDAASAAVLQHAVDGLAKLEAEGTRQPYQPLPRAEFARVGDDTWVAVALGIVEEASVRQEEERAAADAATARRPLWKRLSEKLHHADAGEQPGGREQEASRTSAPGAPDPLAEPGEHVDLEPFAVTHSDVPVLEWGLQHLSFADTHSRFPYHPAPHGRTTVLCVQSDLVDDQEALWTWVQETLTAWEVTGPDLLVVECIPYGDYAIWQHVVEEHFPGAEFMPFARLWREGLPVGEDVRWLTTRFHPHLLASAAGCEGVAVDAHGAGYYAVKHGSVQAAGSLWPMVHPVGLPARPPHHNCDVSRRETSIRQALELAEAIYR